MLAYATNITERTFELHVLYFEKSDIFFTWGGGTGLITFTYRKDTSPQFLTLDYLKKEDYNIVEHEKQTKRQLNIDIPQISLLKYLYF